MCLAHSSRILFINVACYMGLVTIFTEASSSGMPDFTQETCLLLGQGGRLLKEKEKTEENQEEEEEE